MNSTPACPACKTGLDTSVANTSEFFRCPACKANIRIEAFPALYRPIPRGLTGQTVIVPGESTCFYHDAKKAEAVCDACGRFLCALCDCVLHGGHYCPGCLQAGKKHQAIQQLDNVRTLYGRQAFVLSLVPLYITGMLAMVIALRYKKAPGSIVAPRRWMFPAALIIGSIQTVAFTALILLAIYG